METVTYQDAVKIESPPYSDGREGGFDQHGIAKEVRSKQEMASQWQCPRVNDHQVLAWMKIIIGAQDSSISTALFYSDSKHYYNLLLKSQTLRIPNFKSNKL
ncbi:hypothetical protein SO802_006220 [Lithocarpus litseifolius]|uniref:Uncharacterized protein n=1 Tax=Lithocarpus litseifolius TaxID=425828 RepID=A0AAW2DKP7_9ROSI